MTDKLDCPLVIRVSKADMDRLEKVANCFTKIATTRAVARVALRLGLDAIAKDPNLVMNAPIPKRGGARIRHAKRHAAAAGRKPTRSK